MFTRTTCALKHQLFFCVSNITVEPLMYTPIHTYIHNVLGIFSMCYQIRNTPMITCFTDDTNHISPHKKTHCNTLRRTQNHLSP